MSEFRGGSIKLWLEISGQEFDVYHASLQNADSLSPSSIPSVAIKVCVGLDISDSGNVQPDAAAMRLFYEYPVAELKMEVIEIDSLDLPPSLEAGTYTIFRGDITQVAAEKEVTWGQENSVSVTLAVAHLARRLLLGDTSHYPFYNFNPMSPDVVFKDYGGGMTGRQIWGDGTSSLEEFLTKIISWRVEGDTEFIEGFAPRQTAIQRVQQIIDNVDSNQEKALNNYLKEAIENVIAIELDFSLLSTETIVAAIQTLSTTVEAMLESSETSILDILSFIMSKFYGFIAYTAGGGIVSPIPAVLPESSRIKIGLDDYTSCQLGVGSGEPIAKFIGGGTIVRDQTGIWMESVSYNYIDNYELPDDLKKGGAYIHYVAPSWLGTNVIVDSGSEESEDIGTEEGRQDLKSELPDINKEELKRYLSYSVVRRRLKGKVLNIITPLRMDITQGAILEVEVPVGIDDVEIYCGIVTGIGFMADAETETIASRYTITGVEKKQLYDILEEDGKHPFTAAPPGPRAWAEPE